MSKGSCMGTGMAKLKRGAERLSRNRQKLPAGFHAMHNQFPSKKAISETFEQDPKKCRGLRWVRVCKGGEGAVRLPVMAI